MAESSTLLRCFIAIPLPSQTQQRIATLQQQLRRLLPELKTPKVETLHLTLHFLGDQPQEQLAKIGQLMLSIGQKKKNFNVTLQGLGFFPNRQRPQILWLGAKPENELLKLHQQLAAGLAQLGIEMDQRRYRPHLTIGRFRRAPENIAPLCLFLSQGCGNLKIDRMILYTSELAPQGAIHTQLTTAVLNTAAD